MKRNLEHPVVITASGILLTALVLLLLTQLAFAQAAADGADVRLQNKVKYAAEQASVQDIVQNLAEQAGLKYDWKKSAAQTDQLCRNWVRNVTIDGKTCQQALEQILKPVGLRYDVENGVLVLSCQISLPIGKGYVTNGPPPTGLTPARILSAKEQRENLDFLCRAIDETYADFELKAIDWEGVCRRYQERLNPGGGADEFYRLLFQLVNELKDTHSWLENYHFDFPVSGPELTVAMFEGKPFVAAINTDSEPAGLGVKAASEVLEVDGLPVDNKIEQLRLRLPACSSERAFRREACRYLLAGERDTNVKVKLRLPDGRAQTFALRRTGGVSDPPRQPCVFNLKQGRFVQFGRHPSGLGYIRIMSFNAHEEVAPEFDQALEALRASPGLILDIRDNPGGFSQPHIVGRLLQRPALCSISFVKNGPRHGDLKRREDILEPTGQWQYGSPIALLVNDGTGSAADLFACELRSAKRVVTVGSTTHGNLSGEAAFAVLPCGLIVRISNGYICDATGKPIEGVGNEPDVPVSPSIGDILAGRDPVLERAAALLSKKLPGLEVTREKQ
jgi:C-terminal processing protease CtpA/Prc